MTDHDILDAHMEATRIAYAVLVRTLEGEGSLVAGSVSDALRVFMELNRRELGSVTLALLHNTRTTLDELQQDTRRLPKP